MPTPFLSTSVSPHDDSIFISYARADDLKPPFEDTTQGWVTFFWSQLRFELTMRGAKQAELWLDRYQIEPAEAFTPKIEQALTKAKLLIAIFSTNWAQSEWCRNEVEFFEKIYTDANERVIPIYKSELEREQIPVLIQGYESRVGYRFFTSDDLGTIHEFYWRGLRNQEAYYNLIKRIALFIIKRLEIVQTVSPNFPAMGLSSGMEPEKTIFIAAAASDLRDARQRLVNDLKASGYIVVPDDDTLPQTSDELEKVLQAALSKAEYAVHLIGESHGITAENGTEPVVDLQLRLARKTALSRIIWVPRWLPNQKTDKRDPFEVMQHFEGLQESEEIHHGEVTDLSQWLRQRLQPASDTGDNLKHSTHTEINRILVSAAHNEDEVQAIDLANRLQACGYSVQLFFSNDDSPSTQSLNHTLVLIPWGQAGGADLELMLKRLTASAQTICLRLPGGDEKAKRRFFKENIVLEKLDALPENRDETLQLLNSLNIAEQLSSVGDVP